MSDELSNEAKQGLLAGKGFRAGGFKAAGEAIAMEPERTPEQEEAELAQAAMAADAEAANLMSRELELPGSEPEVESEAEVPSAESEAEIRIGSRTFKTQKEAYSYAQELEEQRIASDAFRQGIEAAQNLGKSNNPALPEPEAPPEEVPDYYYTDPARYQKELRERIVTEAAAHIRKQTDMEARSRNTMSQFYKDFPDLVGDEDVVDYFIKKDWDAIKGLETKVGLKLIADNTRNWLEAKVKRRLPAKELPRVTGTASSGSSQPVTQKKPDSTPLNFATQSRNLKTPQGRAAARKRLGL